MPTLFCPKTGNKIVVNQNQVKAFKGHGYTDKPSEELKKKAEAAEAEAAEKAAKEEADKKAKEAAEAKQKAEAAEKANKEGDK